MQQRSVSASRRPSGTDGSDFSYRMVVDSRYTRVAKGKSRLGALLAAQTASQVVWTSLMLLSASHEKKFETFAAISLSVGFISLVIGELGRRRSHITLLRLYAIISSIATVLSVASIIRSDLHLKVIKYQSTADMTYYELLEIGRTLIGVMLQILIIITTVSLVHNMSPKRIS
ncbi:unnamed protein product [Musa acuminata subsp. malaccensis]|uniref:(wild Malaysian banana) hypothetical protein n=1 Tax=Musa acuminata subsp. malaccensis TaxID=214687 RepID=A0A804L9U8_MUSAM|nr:PREDICTED: uncharacterized protein LOC103972076 [Musa acuminata subsp. malaccensis]CAG1865139.1 unnamed protein product [Musa acuminata subsp. malaccensis]